VKRWQTLLIGLAISVLAFYFALRGVDFGKLQLVITEGHYIWLLPVVLCSLISVLSALAIAPPAVPGNVGPFEAAVVFALGLSLLAALDSAGQSRAFGFAVLFHLNSVITFVILGWIGLVQERVTVAGLFQSVQHQPANPS
jgi:hypothetical protein